MDKKIENKLELIKNKKEEAQKCLDNNDVDKAETLIGEARALQKEVNVLKGLYDEALGKVKAGEGTNVAGGEKASVVNVFFKAIKNRLGMGAEPTAEELKVLNVDPMSTKIDEDGGYTVPEEIRLQIKEFRRSEDALETLVNVETVNTPTGQRNIEVNAEHTPFDNVEETEDFPDIEGPKFARINYAIKKKGGILTVTRELLKDSAINFTAYLVKWLGKKGKATRNALILKIISENFGTPIPVANIDDIKDVMNVQLDPAIALSSKIVTNQDGFNYLDKLKDSDGKYILQPDPTQPTKRLLFGRYPVTVISNKTLKTVDGKAPINFGDLKEAITIFDYELLTLDANDRGDGWKNDTTKIKARERLDIKVVDKEAVIKGEIDLNASTDLFVVPTETKTESKSAK